MKTKVFLSGAIEDVGEIKYSWRRQATQMLDSLGFEAINPLDYALEEHGCEPKEIVAKNTFLQKRSDILLVEYTILNRAYIGTDYEMTWAHLHGQPIVVWAAKELSHRVYLNYLATKVAFTLEEAVRYIYDTYPSNKQ